MFEAAGLTSPDHELLPTEVVLELFDHLQQTAEFPLNTL